MKKRNKKYKNLFDKLYRERASAEIFRYMGFNPDSVKEWAEKYTEIELIPKEK